MLASSHPRYLQFEVDKLDLLFWYNRTAFLVNALVTPIIIYSGWGELPWPFLLGWILFLNLFSAFRFFMSSIWRTKRGAISTEQSVRGWHNLVLFMLVITGLTFGALGWATVHYVHGVKAAILSVIVLSVSCGLVPSYVRSISCTNAILLSSLVPWILGCFVEGSSEYFAMGATLSFYLLGNLRRASLWFKDADEIKKLNALLLENEQKLLDALDSSGAIGWEWNLVTDDFATTGNRVSVFGEESRTAPKTKLEFVELFHPEDRPILTSEMELAVQRGLFEVECRVPWPDGRMHFVNVRGRTFKNENGQLVRMCGTCWDLTGTREQERVKYERDLLDAANSAKLMFLANASHEIRTPLSAIHGYAEMALNSQESTQSMREDLIAILRNCKYLVSLVNDLLDLSKAETDNLYIQPSLISPSQEIFDAVQVVRASARQKGLAISVHFDGLIPEKIYSDATRLRQILINLLSNSIKYTKAGNIVLEVSYLDGSSPKIKFLVKDSGIGIDAETRKNLFQPFVRGRHPLSQRTPGSGLGLALSRSLARKLGGDIRHIDSSAGAVFELTLDVGAVPELRFIDANGKESLPPEKPDDGMRLRPFRGLKVLVVDDDEDLRFLTRRFLEDRGAAVSIAADGEQAVQQAGGTTFDLILMDVKMPVMDGYEATARLRQLGYRGPIVALTAHASLQDRQLCFQSGFNWYVSKPVNMRELTEVIIYQVGLVHLHSESIIAKPSKGPC